MKGLTIEEILGLQKQTAAQGKEAAFHKGTMLVRVAPGELKVMPLRAPGKFEGKMGTPYRTRKGKPRRLANGSRRYLGNPDYDVVAYWP